MRKYEIMYILKANLDEAARKVEMDNVEAILTSAGAKVTKTDVSLGLRELAYEIKDETKGFYVVLKVEADERALQEFARKTRHNPSVLRQLVVVDHE